MKCVIALALVVGASTASAQGWNRLPFYDSFGWDSDLRIAPDGTLYVGYLGAGGNARVRRWDGERWESLGSPSCSTSWQSDLFFSRDGEPYYASRDYGAAGAFNVRRYRDGQWELLTSCGSPSGFEQTTVASVHDPDGLVLYTQDLLDSDPAAPPNPLPPEKELHVVMLVNDGYPASDPNFPSSPPELQYEHATVLWGNDGTWSHLGSRRFSDAPASYLDLARWEGQLWVVYTEQSLGPRITLKRFSTAQGDWVTAATLESTPGANTTLTQAFGRLVLVTNSNGYLRAYTYGDGALIPLGAAIATNVHMGQQDWIQKVSCGSDTSGRLYVAYRRTNGHFGICRSVAQPGGQVSWSLFAESDVEMAPTRFVTMAVSAREARVYVVYTDENERPVVVWRPILD